MTRHHFLYPLVLVAGILAGGGFIAYRSPAPTPSAPVAPATLPASTPEADAPQDATHAPAQAVPTTAPDAPAGGNEVATDDPRACDADFARLCPGCVAKLDKVQSVRTAMADSDPTNDATAACVASLDYAQSLNEAVISACKPYPSACASVAPNPRSGTSEGANTSEPLFDCLRAHVGQEVASGGACDLALQAHDAHQQEVKNAPRTAGGAQ